MSRLKVFSALLLLMICVDSQEFITSLEKTISRGLDATPVCRNSSQSFIVLIVCTIKRSRGGECRLLYRHEHGFEHKCDQRFRLTTENRTVVLHLTGLTPEDGGFFTCTCSHFLDIEILHLNVTVEEEEAPRTNMKMHFMFRVMGLVIFIIVNGVMLGFTHKKTRHGNRRQQDLPPSQQAMELTEDSTFTQTTPVETDESAGTT